jgi:Mn-dependent DtxR family transcriptional regulator
MTRGDPETARVTPTMCHSIAAIALEDGAGLVSTQQIAKLVGVSCPTVTNMVKRLRARGLLWRDPYHGVRLTHAGQSRAAEVGRRRGSLERYLVEKLNYPPEEAKIEAVRLEHGATDALVAHIDAALELLGVHTVVIMEPR